MKKITTTFEIRNDLLTQGHGIDIAKTIHPTIYTDQIGLSPSQVAQSQLTSVHSREQRNRRTT